LRFAVAAAVLLAIALVTRAPWPRGARMWGLIALTGLCSQAVSFGGTYTGVNAGVTPSLAALITGLMPVFVALAAGPLLGERQGRMQWLGLGLGFAGVALVVASHGRVSAAGSAAIGLVVVGLLGLTAGTLLQKRFVSEMDVRSGGFIQASVSTLALAPLAWLLEGLRLSLTAQFVGAVGWLVGANSLVLATIMFVMIRRGEASRVAGLFYLIPPVTAVLSALLLHQYLTPLALGGFALAAAGVALAARPSATKQTDAAASERLRPAA